MHIRPPEQPQAEFELIAGHVRTIAEELLTTFFGPRCPNFEPGCEVCRRWRLLDDLLHNPFPDE